MEHGGGGQAGPSGGINSSYSKNGSSNGGMGGSGHGVGSSAGGGSGNPGGLGFNVGTRGQNGTGGLLVLYTKDLINNGQITSCGSNGGTAQITGGSSGGGSINIFYKQNIELNGTISVNGGKSPYRTSFYRGLRRHWFDFNRTTSKWYIHKHIYKLLKQIKIFRL